jgi:lipopolysaccharide biosynthesis glycosyltransferase
MKTAIVTISDEHYLPAACCALLSCIQGGRVNDQVELFLIGDGVSPSALDNGRRFLAYQKVPAQVIERRPETAMYRVDRWVSRATYARLHLDEYFDGSWQRILYLDADTRVMAPLQPLLDCDLRGRALGAVDHGEHDHVSRLSMADDAPYLNAGVLLFNWPEVVSSNLLIQAREFALSNSDLCLYWDQDALNKVFEGLWAPLDPRWNFLRAMIERYPNIRPYIKHYSEPEKPWGKEKKPYWLDDALWYRRVLRNSAWPDFATPISSGDIINAAKYFFRRRVLRK